MDSKRPAPLAELERAAAQEAYRRAVLNDVTVHMMDRQKQPLELIVGVLADQKQKYVDRIMELESIVPRKIVMPDGRVMVWHCADELVIPILIDYEKRP